MTTNNQAQQELRQKFERWWELSFHNGNPPRLGWGYWRDGGGYVDADGELQWRWEAWQAAHSEKLEAAENRVTELTEFIQHVNKCLLKNGEYAPLSHESIQTVLGIRADGKGTTQ